MSEEDERELLRRLEPLRLELWPVLSDAGFSAPLVSAETELSEPAYYLAAGDVIGYPIKKGKERGKWKIDEVISPVIYFSRSLRDDDGDLRSGYFWAETEAAGDNSRTGGNPTTSIASSGAHWRSSTSRKGGSRGDRRLRGFPGGRHAGRHEDERHRQPGLSHTLTFPHHY